MSDERIGDLTTRVVRLEDNVGELKVQLAQIDAGVNALAEQTATQHQVISASLATIHKEMGCPDPHKTKAQKIISDLLTPQTIAIILAILATALGAPMLSQSILSSHVGTQVPTSVPASGFERETQPSPSTPP